MYCPNCGKQTASEQRFCRSCGLGLEKVSQAVGEQLPAQMDENLLAEKRKYEWWGMLALSVFGVGVLGLVLFGIVYKLMIEKGQILGGLAALGFLILIACGLLSTVFFAKANEAAAAAAKRHVPQPGELSKAATTDKLLPEVHLESLPSVTERTTDLLLAERAGNLKTAGAEEAPRQQIK